MKYKTSTERTCLTGRRNARPDMTQLIVGFLLAAVLLFCLANCSSHRPSVQLPAPPSSPAPSTQTTEKAEESSASDTPTQATGKAEGTSSSDTSSEEANAACNAEPSKKSQKKAGSESQSTSSSATPDKPSSTGAQTTEERTGDLDRKLDSSLTEFDGILLKEQENLDARREMTGEPCSGGAYGETGEKPGGSETPEGQKSEGKEQTKTPGGLSGGSPDPPAGKAEKPAPGEPVGGNQAKKGSGRVPPDVGDGKDDDIVARQLREAAMKEEDPKLREKLWDEYRKYKKGLKKN